jgi:nicotinamidase/pyrazinamidase
MNTRAFIIVDVQNDFLPTGALPVPGGGEVIPLINRLQTHFDFVVATQDWHPADHQSFASNHPGKKPGDVIELQGDLQILWPDHCVQNSSGAEFAGELHREGWRKVFRKGTRSTMDSYSGFLEGTQKLRDRVSTLHGNDHPHSTGLEEYLKIHGIRKVYIAGLALDYCVKFTALDARRLGFDVTVIPDACRAVHLRPHDGELATQEMKAAGIHLLESHLFINHQNKEKKP